MLDPNVSMHGKKATLQLVARPDASVLELCKQRSHSRSQACVVLEAPDCHNISIAHLQLVPENVRKDFGLSAPTTSRKLVEPLGISP